MTAMTVKHILDLNCKSSSLNVAVKIKHEGKIHMKKYDNFGLAIYLTARCIGSIGTVENLKEKFAFFEKHLLCSKVFLETHRDNIDIPREQILAFKSFFEKKGIAVSGAITTTFLKTIDVDPLINESGIFGSGGTNKDEINSVEPGQIKQCSTLCYTSMDETKKLKKIIEYTASLFDEIILDDFFSTSCTCTQCIKAKGNRSWEEFRLKLMMEISENIVIKPAKKVNPNVNMIIKYPNWCESYQASGYNPREQSLIFDDIYTGAETRDPCRSPQHLPRYASYSLFRWLENVKPKHNKGAWIDPLDSIVNLDYYLEQAFLPLFAKAPELTLFCFSWLEDTVYIPALGFELEQLDSILGKVGTPVGISVYEPFDSHGENHLYDYLGAAGIPLEPCPEFPSKNEIVFITENSSKDPQIIDKLKTHLISGGNICLTSGFIRAMRGKGIEDLTCVEYSDGKVCSDVYTIWENSCAFDPMFINGQKVTVPLLKYMTNSADSIISLCGNDDNFPLFLKNRYGNGIVYTLNVPDSYSDIFNYPQEILTAIRQYLMSGLELFLECREKISIFLYDNNTFILESFQKFRCKARIHITGNRFLLDIRTGEIIKPIYACNTKSIFEIDMMPVIYRVFKIVDNTQAMMEDSI